LVKNFWIINGFTSKTSNPPKSPFFKGGQGGFFILRGKTLAVHERLPVRSVGFAGETAL
jgi:hypothetical protein